MRLRPRGLGTRCSATWTATARWMWSSPAPRNPWCGIAPRIGERLRSRPRAGTASTARSAMSTADGDADIVMGGVLWFENPGAGAGVWSAQVIDDLRTHDIELADLDGNGRLGRRRPRSVGLRRSRIGQVGPDLSAARAELVDQERDLLPGRRRSGGRRPRPGRRSGHRDRFSLVRERGPRPLERARVGPGMDRARRQDSSRRHQRRRPGGRRAGARRAQGELLQDLLVRSSRAPPATAIGPSTSSCRRSRR